MKVGIVGMPNAGKSSLFNALTRAGADAANYPFTTIEPNAPWYPAEDYHQNYVARTGAANPYCVAVVAPKLQKFRKSYQARLKSAQVEAP